jgi:nitrate/nitrite transporter NarK
MGSTNCPMQVGLADAFGKLGEAVADKAIPLLAVAGVVIALFFALVLVFVVFVVVMWARWRGPQ